MPNWCSCDLTIKGKPEVLKAILSHIKGTIDGEAVPITFEKIIPMPPELNVDSGTFGENGYVAFHDAKNPRVKDLLKEHGVSTVRALREKLNELDKRYKKDGDAYRDNLAKHGHKTWYDWSLENWGTKWDASEPRIKSKNKNKVVIQFETAWSPPKPVIEKLGADFPEAEFVLQGFECGAAYQVTLVVKNGEVKSYFECHYDGDRGG